VTLREENGLWVLKNRVLRRIFSPKRDEVTGDWRKLQNEELACSTNGEKRMHIEYWWESQKERDHRKTKM
jgi:hypothetical protein